MTVCYLSKMKFLDTPSLLILTAVEGTDVETAHYALITINESFKQRRSLLPKMAKIMARRGEDISGVKFTFPAMDVVFGNFDALADSLDGVMEEKFARNKFVIFYDDEEIARIMADVEGGKYEMAEVTGAEMTFTATDCRVTAKEGEVALTSVPFQSQDVMFAELAAA